MPSSTVEDYLKCIWREQRAAGADLVATGRIAASLEVSPGTVTAMVKTLSESGLLDYEPYSGVRLTPAGERLASRVVRRHRLVELFLVRVLGMSWSEVHGDAEILEHAVSDRLLDRIDEMLGRPEADPHGDPIPTPGGLVPRLDASSDLLGCPTARPLEVLRVTDQRAEFLRLLEKHGILPGRVVRVLARDDLADTVEVQPEGGDTIRLGFRAASTVRVRPVVGAQTP